MPPNEQVFREDSDDESELNETPLEPGVLVPPASSMLSINNLSMKKGSSKKVTCLTRFSGVLYTLISSFIFTCVAFSIKQIGIDLIDAFLIRFVIQISITLLFVLYKGYPLISDTTTQKFLQILCCTGGAGSFVFYFIATRYVELSDVTTLAYTRVVWTVVFSAIIYRERPSIGSLVALPLTLLGVIFVSQPSFLFSSAISSISVADSKVRLFGLSLAIASALASAANVLSFKQLVSKSKSMKPSVINLQYCIATFIFLIIYQLYKRYFLHTGLTFEYVLSWRYLLASALCVFLIIPNILIQKAIKREHPAIFTLLCSTEIIYALILQAIFTNKRSNVFALLGSALVIFSVVILGLSKIIDERRAQKKIQLMDKQSILFEFKEEKKETPC